MNGKNSACDDESMIRKIVEARRGDSGLSLVTAADGHGALTQAMVCPILRAQGRYVR
jgi:hypothetical protein